LSGERSNEQLGFGVDFAAKTGLTNPLCRKFVVSWNDSFKAFVADEISENSVFSSERRERVVNNELCYSFREPS